MFDLKSFREESKYPTQKEFAELIGVRQDTISRLEKNPDSIGLDVLVKIANATGTTLDELVGYKKVFPEALEVENTWNSVAFTKKRITEYISKALTKKFQNENHTKMIVEMSELTEKSLRKPKMAIVGLSDSGKSTLINSLLGEEKMPTSWTPTTAISVYLKHIDERPDYISDPVWILKSQVGNEIGWDPNRIYDETYCKEWFAESGQLEVLETYAVRGTTTNDKIGAAIVYLNSPILKVCDIIDLPGFGTGDRELDDQLSTKARDYADLIVYMSISNGFLRGNDIEFLKNVLNSLPAHEHKDNGAEPLSNLFIVGSQAHVIHKGNKVELKRILDEGSKRLFSQIPEEIWVNRSEITGFEYSLEELRSRFFTYTKDIEDLRVPFETSLLNFVESYPNILNRKFKESLNNICKGNKVHIQEEIKQYKDIIAEREKYENLLKDVEKAEPNRRNESQCLKENVITKIDEFKRTSMEEFTVEYNALMSVESIIDIIDQKGYSRKKNDTELLGGYLSSKLQARLQKILKDKSLLLSDEVNNYIKNFDTLINDTFKIETSSLNISFDAERVFASGLAGLATFGGLAVWASTMGNLGAYILVAKGVSFLSAVGISISGGTAGAAATVAAIGGPVVLGIALAAIVALAAFALLGTGWKKSLANEIIRTYAKRNVYLKFENSIKEYWNNTEIAFDSASEELELGYLKYIQELKDITMNSDIDELEKKIQNSKEFYDFLGKIPL